MYYIEVNFFCKVIKDSEEVFFVKGEIYCWLYKVMLCYYDLKNFV